MAWKGVITNVGAAMLAEWTQGNLLNITRAAAGTGTVDDTLLITQTSLVSEKASMSVVTSRVEENMTKLKLQLTAPETGFGLNQIGVWATLEEGSPTLLAIFQNAETIQIPSFAESPDFVYGFYSNLIISNTGTLEITIDPSALVTQETLEEYVADAISGKEDTENKVVEITPSSTDEQYPSAKSVYDGIIRYINLKDTATQVQYRLGIENGIMYIEDYEEDT